ncbi:MAG TPA: response regulator [Burkholderiales bacterium]|nr:response regulator [Burkholderiales bacterium]
MNALKKILVVDDDPVVGRSFDRVLSPKGYAVISATSGAEALERLEAEKYDMVYTDIKMPGMDGIEVAKRIKAGRPWLPVVIVTGYGTEANEAEARAAGVAEFLHKPLSPETIEGSAHFAYSAVALPAPAAATSPMPARSVGRLLKNVGLFFAAPFIGLAYVVLLPFLGIGVAGWAVYKAIKHR